MNNEILPIPTKTSRRNFFKWAASGLGVMALLKIDSLHALACPQKGPTTKKVKDKLFDYKSTKATKLKFVENAADAKKIAPDKFKAGSNCANCRWYNKKEQEPGYATCTMVGRKYVPACGWCKSWAKNKKKKA